MQVQISVIRLPLGGLGGLGVRGRAERCAHGGGECDESGTMGGWLHGSPLELLCEKMQALNHPKRRESADGVGWYPGGPVRQAARQTFEQLDDQKRDADE